MNTNRQIIRLGMLLFLITMSIFFLLIFLFSTQGKISDAQYFNYSAMINCFVLPGLYAGIGFYSTYIVAKKRPVSFRQAWQLSFLPMFLGGILSLASIFIFFNTSGVWAEDSLQRGWYDLMTSNPNPEFMEKNGEFVKSMTDLSINMFTWKVFFLSFSVIIFFYFLISSIFAVFFKNRRV
ncbi:DUF4199 family protein [Moheibacter sp.]|uniref:DUF4199 family protein n=1 Tax=Moheibacter sp. TaxID=1965316 RepID=UPI003C7543B7